MDSEDAAVQDFLEILEEHRKNCERQGKYVTVLNVSTIKPLDQDAVISLAQKSGCLVTVEEHQIAGGLGSAIAECVSAHYPVPIEYIGVRDQFGQSGTPEELIAHYGMDEKDILTAVHKVILRKK